MRASATPIAASAATARPPSISRLNVPGNAARSADRALPIAGAARISAIDAAIAIVQRQPAAAARRQRTTGSVDGSPVLRHFGCPNPPALTPLPPSGLSVMSNTMLSGRVRVAADAADPGEEVEVQRLPHAPRDVVVGARRVAADADAADQAAAAGVEAEAAAEDVHAADSRLTIGSPACRTARTAGA